MESPRALSKCRDPQAETEEEMSETLNDRIESASEITSSSPWSPSYVAGVLADCKQRIQDLENLIRNAQKTLSNYLPPDSGISEHECVNQMLGLFDGPECRKVLPNE